MPSPSTTPTDTTQVNQDAQQQLDRMKTPPKDGEKPVKKIDGKEHIWCGQRNCNRWRPATLGGHLTENHKPFDVLREEREAKAMKEAGKVAQIAVEDNKETCSDDESIPDIEPTHERPIGQLSFTGIFCGKVKKPCQSSFAMEDDPNTPLTLGEEADISPIHVVHDSDIVETVSEDEDDNDTCVSKLKE